jgi:hypothetical protein
MVLRSSRWGWIASSVLLLSVAGGVGCAPTVTPDENLSDDELLKLVSSFALNASITCDDIKASFGMPHVPSVATPGGLGLPYEEVFVENRAGNALRVWYVPATLDRGTVVLSMGAIGDMSCFLFIVDMLYLHGWSTVIYDPQGFGGSEGEPSVTALYSDFRTVIDWTRTRVGDTPLTLYGVSIGTIPSVAYAADHPGKIRAVILDAPISLRDELERFRTVLGTALEGTLHALDEELLLENTLPRLEAPALAILYGLDEYVSSSKFEALAAASEADVAVHWFPELGHARGPYLGSASYFYLVDQFLNDPAGWQASPAD